MAVSAHTQTHNMVTIRKRKKVITRACMNTFLLTLNGLSLLVKINTSLTNSVTLAYCNTSNSA